MRLSWNAVAGLVGLVFLLSGLWPSSEAWAGDRYGKQKVVYHFNSSDLKTIKGGLRNITNHLNAAPEAEIVVVAHGGGIVMFDPKKSTPDILSKIQELKMRGVKFNLCANTVRKKKYDIKKDLKHISQADIVPSGVAEVARLQGMGYVYIKP